MNTTLFEGSLSLHFVFYMLFLNYSHNQYSTLYIHTYIHTNIYIYIYIYIFVLWDLCLVHRLVAVSQAQSNQQSTPTLEGP